MGLGAEGLATALPILEAGLQQGRGMALAQAFLNLQALRLAGHEPLGVGGQAGPIEGGAAGPRGCGARDPKQGGLGLRPGLGLQHGHHGPVPGFLQLPFDLDPVRGPATQACHEAWAHEGHLAEAALEAEPLGGFLERCFP